MLPWLNATGALARLTAGRAHETEHGCSSSRSPTLPWRLRRTFESFCASKLLPAALLDTVADVCHAVRAAGRTSARARTARTCSASGLRWHNRSPATHTHATTTSSRGVAVRASEASKNGLASSEIDHKTDAAPTASSGISGSARDREKPRCVT